MKRLLLFFTIILSSFTSVAQIGNVQFKIENFKSSEGQLIYLLFNSKEGFPKDAEKALIKGTTDIKDETVLLQFESLPFGKYALIVIHDEDGNNKLKRNWFGIPKEGIGNSNNHRGIPNFNKSSFVIGGDVELIIDMWYL